MENLSFSATFRKTKRRLSASGLMHGRLRQGIKLKNSLDAWGWCTGTTQRDGMGREEGGGFRMGNTCIPVADSF